jgi:hypothetical protein
MCQMRERHNNAKSGVLNSGCATGVNACIPTAIPVYPGRHDKISYPFPSGHLSGFRMVYKLLHQLSLGITCILWPDPVSYQVPFPTIQEIVDTYTSLLSVVKQSSDDVDEWEFRRS